jgi:hypothetical protein
MFRHYCKSSKVQALAGECVGRESHPFGPGMVKELLDHCRVSKFVLILDYWGFSDVCFA